MRAFLQESLYTDGNPYTSGTGANVYAAQGQPFIHISLGLHGYDKLLCEEWVPAVDKKHLFYHTKNIKWTYPMDQQSHLSISPRDMKIYFHT